MIADVMLNRVSLKLRIVALATGTIAFALFAGGVVLMHNAREAIASETRSAAQFAQSLFTTAMQSRHQPSETELHSMCAALDAMRHVRVGLVRDAAALIAPLGTREDVHPWLLRLLAPADPVRVFIPLGREGRGVAIAGDPFDELREIQDDFRVTSGFVAGGALCLLILVYGVMRVGLQPLSRLLVAFDQLTRGDFGYRVDERAVPELRRIHRAFNLVAGELERMVDDNRQLTGALMKVQETERKALAHDLHDEMAPHLFSIRVATSGARALADAPPVGARLDEIEIAVVHLQTQVRRMLTRLRPHALEAMGFENAVNELVDSWRRRLPDVVWAVSLAALPEDVDEDLLTNLYLVIQECLTNAARHADARHVSLGVTLVDGRVRACVEDDGAGFAVGTARGYGILGMRERVRRFDGQLDIASGPTGTRVTAEFALREAADRQSVQSGRG